MSNIVVGAGQQIDDLLVSSGDSVTVMAGGIANGVTVEAGASMTVQSGGAAVDTLVSATGDGFAQLYIASGGVATGTVLDAANSDFAQLFVESGGSAADTTVGDGGAGFALANVAAGGTITATTVGEYGAGTDQLTLDADAIASGTTIGAAGMETINVTSGEIFNLPAIGDNVIVSVESGGTITAGTLVDGGWLESAITTGVTVTAGLLLVGLGCSATSDLIAGGMVEIVQGATGVANVVTGGELNVFYSFATGTLVNGPATEEVQGGTVWNSTVENGGNEILLGGTAYGTVLNSGGSQTVDSNSTAINTVVNAGATETIYAGGIATDTTLEVGGTIDLSSFAFGLGVSASLNHVTDQVTITNGSTTMTLQLAGDTSNEIITLSAATPRTVGATPGTVLSAEAILSVADTTSDQALPAASSTYTGPVAGLQTQYIDDSSDNLSVTVNTDNWFIHTGSGEDAIGVAGGTNVLDGGTGSNFLVGGSGTGFDTFFVDDRGATAPIWSTVVNFHAGDAATVWGVTAADFSLTWLGNQGAGGYTGLTLTAASADAASASLTLAGFTPSDLTNGKLSVTFGTSAGNPYLYIVDKG